MVPLQWAMSVTLPATAGAHAHHQAFPRQPVYIVGVDDTVEVMQSLQKPKKIALRGSDGQSYVFLCKPKDDLRKDFRCLFSVCWSRRCGETRFPSSDSG